MRIYTVCENRTFQRAYSKGKKYAGVYTVVYALTTKRGETRVGLTVTKQRGGAVERNRIKRVIRAGYRSVVGKYEIKKSCDIIIVARSAALAAKSTAIAYELAEALKHLGIIDGAE